MSTPTTFQTRWAAYCATQPKMTSHRQKIIAHLASCGAIGDTDEGIADATGLPYGTACGRRFDLCTLGLVEATGRKCATRTGTPAAMHALIPDPSQAKPIAHAALRQNEKADLLAWVTSFLALDRSAWLVDLMALVDAAAVAGLSIPARVYEIETHLNEDLPDVLARLHAWLLYQEALRNKR